MESGCQYLLFVMQGYLAESKLFVTQCPLDETVIDFWTMMFDHGSRIIVLLDPANKVRFVDIPRLT